MKREPLFDECRRRFVTPDICKQVKLSVGIANRIYDVLSERKMSIKEFAELVGTSETEVENWLMGTHDFRISTIVKIEIALGISILSV